MAKERAKEQFELLKDIQGDLEKVEVVFYSHDVPWQFVGHEYRSSLLDSASVGECEYLRADLDPAVAISGARWAGYRTGLGSVTRGGSCEVRRGQQLIIRL